MITLQRTLLTFVALICSAIASNAATLQAKVVEVRSGNTLVVSNINRSVQVRLISIMPPEIGQPFNDMARDHLKALVLDKTVTVEYRHLVEDFLEAKVLLNGVDIGSQLLRDGVVWYDQTTDYELNDSDRELYAQCEKAARTEKRGLWQQESPLAPWEFRRMQQAKRYDAIYGRYGLQTKGKSSLSNGDLIGALLGGPRGSSAAPGLRPIVQNGSFDRWTSFESPIAHFSIMVPSNGVEGTAISPGPNGTQIPFHVLAAGSERAFLVLVEGKGPNKNYTDASALDESIRGLIGGMNKGAAQHGHTSGEMISAKPVRDLKLGGFVGRQYNLTSDLFSGTARVFTKRNGEERQVFVLYAVTLPGGESIASQFLNSFKIIQ